MEAKHLLLSKLQRKGGQLQSMLLDNRMPRVAAHICKELRKTKPHWYELLSVGYDGTARVLQRYEKGKLQVDVLNRELHHVPSTTRHSGVTKAKGPSLAEVETIALQLLELGCTGEELNALNGKGLQETMSNYLRDIERRTKGMKN